MKFSHKKAVIYLFSLLCVPLRYIMLAAVQALVARDCYAHVPEWLRLTAVVLWPTRQREFLQTNCLATSARLQYMLAPDSPQWHASATPPSALLCPVPQ